MNQLTVAPKKLFIAYASKDIDYVKELENHLTNRNVDIWHEGIIEAGKAKDETIQQQIEEADIILLLISSDFLADDDFYDQSLRYILHKHQQQEVQLIPIILRHCNWKASPFGQMQTLPKDGLPVLRSRSQVNIDREFTQIAQEVQRIIQQDNKSLVSPNGSSTNSEQITFLFMEKNENETAVKENTNNPKIDDGSRRPGCSINIMISLSILLLLCFAIYWVATNNNSNSQLPITIPTPFPQDSNPQPPFVKDTLSDKKDSLPTKKGKLNPSDTVIIDIDSLNN